MPPSPMERHFLDLMDRIEADRNTETTRLQALDQRLTRIEAALAQIQADRLPPDQLMMLVEGITILSKQLEMAQDTHRTLQRATADLLDVMTYAPSADGA